MRHDACYVFLDEIEVLEFAHDFSAMSPKSVNIEKTTDSHSFPAL